MPVPPSAQPQFSSAAAAGALDGCALVYFGNDWNAENRTSSHHIARRLAQTMPLLYVDSPGMRAPKATARDVRKILRKLQQAAKLPTQVGDRLWHCTVPQLPFRWLAGVTFLNERFARWALARAITHLRFTRYLLWFALPHPGFLAGKLGEDAVVYYCIDDYAAHPGVDASAIQRCDDALTKVADWVFVAPPALMPAKLQINASARFSPHGVDAQLFARASDPLTEVPTAIADLQHPVVGFFGSVADWVDVSLIAKLARERPSYSILLVGHVSTDVSELAGLANVRMVGAQRYESLPNWARAFDVAIIPYRRNRQVMNANPLKLREYLATGKPVVSVSTPEVDRFAEFVAIARSADEFVTLVDKALRQDDPAASQRRMQSVADSSWDMRVAQTVAIVRDELQRRLASNRAKRDGRD
jgi:glycosyltransferase involved in cell wall biosynthesis